MNTYGTTKNSISFNDLLSVSQSLPPMVSISRVIPVRATPIYAPARPHHKKRIAKKWLKRYGQKVVGETRLLPDDKVYQVGDTIIANEDVARQLNVAVRERQRKLNEELYGDGYWR